MTYGFLRMEEIGDESVSEGLHHATRTPRDRWANSETDIGHGKSGVSEPARDSSVVVHVRKRLQWFPYIHYGA